ncbi:hypothetical protein ACIQZG_22045 [Lysinibacillus sp. NPDC096418]|uniref:hypothetical protein n=1 Tax=Lysinibacillus sp. NPDC096418 TaxID=3364138 RepID=UPI0038164F22
MTDINNYMVLSEAAERYDVSLDMIKNRLKPSKVGQEQIDQWVSEGLIRLSGRTWIISTDFMKMHFEK